MEKTVIYADLTFLVNFSADFIILLLTAKLSLQRPRWLRLFLGAFLGGGYAVFYIYHPGHWAFALGGKVFFSLIMLFVVFQPKTKSAWKTAALVYYLLNIVAAGLFLVLRYAAGRSLAAYAPIFLGTMLLTAALGYRLHTVLGGILLQAAQLQVEVRLLGRRYTGPGFIDTGNELQDPLSHAPVIVTEPQVLDALTAGGLNWADADGVCALLPSPWRERLRVIPYAAVGKTDGVLVGFRCDAVLVSTCLGVKICRHAVVAAAPEPIFGGKAYRFLVPPSFWTLMPIVGDH
jgi:stage II sporulation protein GA (sporulation sigma-E factor processing peptidase)